MKRAVICGACKTLTRAALTYTVSVPVERETFQPNGARVISTEPVVMNICHACAKAAGYKVRRATPAPTLAQETQNAPMFDEGSGKEGK